ncbi:hypothetical protein CEXT_193101 [Caerostris extrusa]|uniref:Uncharacterized protein n=1 Tax=Caerostris extrusa TaxID=172846 RepID=A0AAV4RUW0_CAEEX|nr:hypothetical protein CEXT_193031 [Caerostris extrusa]GIY25161.1 hypothetical protein CEXT_193101 [Caerostris extrusa]
MQFSLEKPRLPFRFKQPQSKASEDTPTGSGKELVHLERVHGIEVIVILQSMRRALTEFSSCQLPRLSSCRHPLAPEKAVEMLLKTETVLRGAIFLVNF